MSESVDELLHQVDRALEDHASADQVTQTVRILTELENQLAPYVADLERVVGGFGALDKVRRPAERPDTRALAAACRAAAELVRHSKTAPQDLPRTLRHISDVVTSATGTARDGWREYIELRMPGLDSLGNLAEMLGQLRADRAQAAVLRKGVSDLRAMSRRLPDQAAPGQAVATVNDIRAALSALLGGSDADSDEVRHFIEAVARGGARVDALTPAITDWMRRIGIAGSFKIVAGQPAGE